MPAQPSASPARPKVLIACSHFWPSVGGLETSMAQLGAELTGAGYEVAVMTMAFPGRAADSYLGIRILGVEPAGLRAAIRAAVASGEYAAAILVQDPLGHIVWSVEGLAPPPSTRVLVQPIINEDGYGRWKDDAGFRGRLAALLSGAGAALTMTKSGPDMRFMREAGIDCTYIPNASLQTAPAGDFRARFGIAPGAFMVLHVANVYWVKNHIGLIDALPDLPPDWKLVMIGNLPAGSDCAEALLAKLRTRPDVLFIPGLPAEWIAAAMHAADTVVLASHGEGSPITLLEAMSCGKPWLATPQCGAANDHLGGMICALPEFGAHLRLLSGDPALRAELGEVSLAHWRECYSWPVVRDGWCDLIEHGRLRRGFEPSASLAGRMLRLRARIERTLRGTHAVRAPRKPLLSLLAVAGGSDAGALAEAAAAHLQDDVELVFVDATGAPCEALLERLRLRGAVTYAALPAGAAQGELRNAALGLARGDYLAFVGAGTPAGRPGELLRLLAAGHCRLAYAGAADVDTVQLAARPLLALDACVFARSLAEETGPFDEAPELPEQWTWLQRAARRTRFVRLPSAPAPAAPQPDAALLRRVYAAVPAGGDMALAAARQDVLDGLGETGFGSFDAAALDVGGLFEAAGGLQAIGRGDLAARLYRAWLARAETPLHYAAWFNLGATLENLGQMQAAAQAYRESLRRNPDFTQARARLAQAGA